ncbi:MAG: undecaprenyl-phosphate galactose phosphotransferase [Gammaproteobacteria bacterium]|jgi:putative colanic acid biosynthesis UDP-glucose lipid carrier transferase|nr:undecaprenyl-phosphate galactose phosphotransferase [Gammaproteobacteria bacterium]
MHFGILKKYSSLFATISFLVDELIVIASGYLAYYLRFANLSGVPSLYNLAILIGCVIAYLCFYQFGLYEPLRGKQIDVLFKRLFTAWASILLIFALLAFFTKTGESFSRLWLIEWFAIGFFSSVVFRILAVLVMRTLRKKGYNHRTLYIIGAGDLGKHIAKTIHEAMWTGYLIKGFFDDNTSLIGTKLEDIPVSDLPSDWDAYLAQNPIDEIWIALPLCAEQRIKEIMIGLRHSTVNVRLVPDIFGLGLLNHSISEIAGVTTLTLRESPMRGLSSLIKNIEDRVLAFIILLLISPLLMVIALAIKFTSKGPVLFKQKRYGIDGKLINVYKFRSMYIHQEEEGKVTQAKKGDARITKVGHFIRRTSLDELPQFFNVLQGRMSIVGPRPHAVAHNEQYKDLVAMYMQRHIVKPGITGWAQVNGLRGETDTLEKMQKRVEYDLYYIEHWSIWFDFKIILMTIFKGFVDKNAR